MLGGTGGYDLLTDLWNHPFTDHVKPLIILSLNTGARRGELFDMTWENVDLERRIMTVTGVTAKSKRTRHIPLNREATSVLQVGRDLSQRSEGLVFVNDAGQRFDCVTSRAGAVILPTSTIFPSCTATSARKASFPLPSTTKPHAMIISYIVAPVGMLRVSGCPRRAGQDGTSRLRGECGRRSARRNASQ